VQWEDQLAFAKKRGRPLPRKKSLPKHSTDLYTTSSTVYKSASLSAWKDGPMRSRPAHSRGRGAVNGTSFRNRQPMGEAAHRRFKPQKQTMKW
jgi:hypothetical protein